MGHLVTIRTVDGTMVQINNNQLTSDFLWVLIGDGQTIDNDTQRRAGTVTTSSQMQESIVNILGRPFPSLGTALLADRQLSPTRLDAQWCSRPLFFDLSKIGGWTCRPRA